MSRHGDEFYQNNLYHPMAAGDDVHVLIGSNFITRTGRWERRNCRTWR